jgi:hypothetical protein
MYLQVKSLRIGELKPNDNGRPEWTGSIKLKYSDFILIEKTDNSALACVLFQDNSSDHLSASKAYSWWISSKELPTLLKINWIRENLEEIEDYIRAKKIIINQNEFVIVDNSVIMIHNNKIYSIIESRNTRTGIFVNGVPMYEVTSLSLNRKSQIVPTITQLTIQNWEIVLSIPVKFRPGHPIYEASQNEIEFCNKYIEYVHNKSNSAINKMDINDRNIEEIVGDRDKLLEIMETFKHKTGSLYIDMNGKLLAKDYFDFSLLF